MYNCPEHGINCPANFSFSNNKKLELKSNKIGKPFGASDVNINRNRFESLDNIRNMFGLNNNISSSLSGLLGASTINQQFAPPASQNNNICNKKEHLKDLLKIFNLS